MMNFNERYEMLFPITRTEDRMVAVFRDRFADIAVVIKQYKKLTSSHADQLRREIGLASQLNHPFIARASHFDQNDEGYFLISDYVGGLSLGQLVKIFGRLDEITIRDIADKLFEGIGYCHKKDILHKDLKPENILMDFQLTPDELKECLDDYRANNHEALKKKLAPLLTIASLKIIDFGIAQTAESTNYAGTPAFSSPEQLQKRTLDGRTDIFSAGLVLYYIGAGCSLPHISAVEFGKLKRDDILRKMKDWKIPKINSLSDRLNQIIARCLRIDPTERYSSAPDVLADLKKTETPFDEKTQVYNEDIHGATANGRTENSQTGRNDRPKPDAHVEENTGTNTAGRKTEERVYPREQPMPFRSSVAAPAKALNAAPVVSALFTAAAAGIIYVVMYIAGLNIDPAITGGVMGLLVAVFICEKLDEIDIVIFVLTGAAVAKITTLCCKNIGFAFAEGEAALIMATLLITGLSAFYSLRRDKED